MKSVPEFGGAKNKLTAFGLSKTFTAQKKNAIPMHWPGGTASRFVMEINGTERRRGTFSK